MLSNHFFHFRGTRQHFQFYSGLSQKSFVYLHRSKEANDEIELRLGSLICYDPVRPVKQRAHLMGKAIGNSI